MGQRPKLRLTVGKTIIIINHVCLSEARWGRSPPKVKGQNFILGQTYVSNDDSSRKC